MATESNIQKQNIKALRIILQRDWLEVYAD